VMLRPRPWWHWLVLGVFALAAIGGGSWRLRQRKPQAAQERPTYVLPEPATPFAVISLLRRMEADPSLRWADSDRAELGKNIRWLEAYFFSRERNGDPEPDLVDVGRRWVALAGNGR
jgi:hypothetical protein